MDVATVAELFRKTSGLNSNDIKLAESQLQQLSRTHGFYICITKIIQSRNYDDSVRFPAVLYLKNNVEKIWCRPRSNTHFTLTEEEKALIRTELLTRFDEPNDLIYTQLAVIIGSIARQDCPNLWPQLIPTLSDAIFQPGGDSLVHNRALFALSRVVKILSSKMMISDKNFFAELSSRIFNPLVLLWKSHAEVLFGSPSSNSADLATAHASGCLTCLETLRYVINYGFSGKYDVFDVQLFMNQLPVYCKQIFDMVIREPVENQTFTKKLEKIVEAILKMIVEFEETHWFDFVPWFSSWLDLCAYMVFHERVYDQDQSIIKLRSMVFLKVAVECYRCKTNFDTKNKEVAEQILQLVGSFFSGERVQSMCFNLMKHYLIINEDVLQQWKEEPEIFATASESHSWQEYLPAAAEEFFIKLVHLCWSDLKECLPVWIAQITQRMETNDAKAILEKDALLFALGLVADDLYDEIDFDSLFDNYFSSYLDSPPDGSHWSSLIRRRILWVCGQWVKVKFAKASRRRLYALLLTNMDSRFDIVTRITACQSFKCCVDEFEFSLDDFKPLIPPSVTTLIDLLKSCKTVDAQTVVLTTLLVLVERLGPEIKLYLDPILSQVPLLWNTDDNLLKNCILSLCTQLVKVLKNDSIQIAQGLCVILPITLDIEKGSDSCLAEDGLDLLLALVENTSTPLPLYLLDLAIYLPDLMASQSTYIRVGCEIIKAYCRTQMDEFLNPHLMKFSHFALETLDEIRSEGQIVILKTVVIALRCYKHAACPFFSGVVKWCVDVLNRENKEPISVLIEVCSILALVSMYNIDILLNAIGPSEEAKIVNCLSLWMNNFTLTTHIPDSRKLYALGLCHWLILPYSYIDLLFVDMFRTLFETLRQIEPHEFLSGNSTTSAYYNFETNDSNNNAASNLMDASKLDEFIDENDKRAKLIRNSDPIYMTSLRNIILESLNRFKNVRCLNSLSSFWTKVDSSLYSEFKDILPA